MEQKSIAWMAECATTSLSQAEPKVLFGGYDPQDNMLTRGDVNRLYYDRDFCRAESPLRPGYRRLSVIREQQLVDPSEYDSPENARRLLKQGATLMFHVAHVYMDRPREAGQQLADAAGIPIHVTAYLTAAKSQGLPLHADAESVFAVQMEGAKTWRFFEPRTTDPNDKNISWVLEDGETEKVAPRRIAVYEVTLRRGDILFVPRGWGHYAVSEEVDSLHVSLGVLHPELDQSKAAFQEPLIPQCR
jgi:hypothetical protein